ncbi:MAG: PKD domain-containing protein [Chloroflexi bacterium]|nr:PKD domain-containing protein [Chloroflexota bacterium]
MRLKLLAVSIILILVCSLVPPSQQVSASSFEVNYTLTLEKEDYPEITVSVQGYPDQSAEFVFLGPSIISISSLDSIFQKMEVMDLAGNNLYWQWTNKGISVINGSVKDFTIRYSIDAIPYQWQKTIQLLANRKCVLFRFGRISFAAGDVFLTPKSEPEKITVDYSLPEGTTLYASLPSENGTFQAIKDLWGNLQLDFSLAYFAGGQALFTLNHTTEWGDEYQYIWFDRDYLSEAWTPWYGNTPWEQAQLYMESTESCARYFRDTIGPLPNHRVLFTNTIELSSSYPNVASSQPFFHYMQIWPRYSEPDTCHHVLHQYQSKLAFGEDSIGKMLMEGPAMYYEEILLSPLFEDPRSTGKLFEFYVLDARGIPIGIRGNEMHVKYNVSALKLYLLDQYVRSVTGGKDSLDDFVKAMWEKVKDNPEPQQMSQADIQSAFSSVVGSENAGYLDQLTNLDSFDLQEFSDLRSPFSAYADWMIHEYFWDKPILFYMFLDIVAAKGNEWPHWATGPHLVIGYGRQALQPVWDYLSAHSGNPITQSDILKAMSASTGWDHAGFFEFWESLGITLDPNEVADLANWDPKARRLEDMVPKAFLSIGNLSTEHLLAEVPQKATIHLDAPAPTNQIFIGFKYFAEGFYLFFYKGENVIQGDNVSVVESWTEPYEKFNVTTVIYRITTDDPDNQDFPITLTYPNVNGVSRFSVSVNAPKGDQLGDLYYLGPIQPITFELDNKNNEVILPDTTLEGETFFASSGGETVQYKPGDKIQLFLATGPVEVQLFDRFGFIRGMNNVIPINLPPTANFDFNSSNTDTQMTMQFTDTSIDPDGQIKDWFWNFGDGQTSSEKDPLYTFKTTGSYSVSLTVIDELSGSDTKVERIVVGGKPQNLPQNNTIELKLLLIISGILIGSGLVFIFIFSHKKKREKPQIESTNSLKMKHDFLEVINQKKSKKLPIKNRVTILGAAVVLALVFGVFRERLFVSINDNLNSTPSGAAPIISEVPVINTNDSTVSLSAFSDLAIILNGDASDWPMVSPLATDLEDSGPYDFKSLYAFSDEKYLYLRIDPNGSFSTDVPVHFAFDIIGVGEKNLRWKVTTEPNNLVNVYLSPVVNKVPQIDLRKKYQGFGLDKVFELVIPLEDLGNPKKIIIQAYANDDVNPFPQFDSFDPVTVSFDSIKITINETANPNTKDGMTMLFVPEGEFTMGSDVNTDEQPIHAVYLDSFWIDQTEVTNAMYAQCVTGFFLLHTE